MKLTRSNKSADSEDLCRRCGISCHPAAKVGVLRVVLPDVHCKFLGHEEDGKTFCTVYDRRFSEAPWCLTAKEAAPRHLLSQDCLYHGERRDRGGKAFLHPRILASIRPQIVEQVLTHGVPHWVTLKGIDALLSQEGLVRRSERVDEEGIRWIEVDSVTAAAEDDPS
jgi:uncharacterized cysteine cluster protein YcgN (CxxCxxCC family)